MKPTKKEFEALKRFASEELRPEFVKKVSAYRLDPRRVASVMDLSEKKDFRLSGFHYYGDHRLRVGEGKDPVCMTRVRWVSGKRLPGVFFTRRPDKRRELKLRMVKRKKKARLPAWLLGLVGAPYHLGGAVTYYAAKERLGRQAAQGTAP